jgi:hypothetical protein
MADLPIAKTRANARSAIKDGTSQIPFSVTQQFGRLTFRIHTAFNTEVANCTREYLSLIAETVDSIWATVFQAHRIPAMQTNEFFVRTDEARLQKFMRHVSPPPPANVQIRGGECVYRWAEYFLVRALVELLQRSVAYFENFWQRRQSRPELGNAEKPGLKNQRRVSIV